MSNFGLKVGTNLNTNTTRQLRLTTARGSLKLHKWVNAYFTTDGSGVGSVTVSHDLDYKPLCEVWQKHTSQFTFLSATSYSDTYSLLDSFNSYRPSGRGIVYYPTDSGVVITTIAIGGYGGGASPNTTYYFRVLIYVDPSEEYSGASTISLSSDMGFKYSNDGVDVLVGEEYQMKYSTSYKSIMYYPNHVLSSSLTLPGMWATRYDTFEQEAVYVDFNHNLGYPPLFQPYSNLGGSYLYEVPYTELNSVGLDYIGVSEISAWCDASRIRVLFTRSSKWISGSGATQFSDTTISVAVAIFAENLNGTESG